MQTIQQYYGLNPKKEWIRLFKDNYHQIEYLVTFHYLKKYLPAKGKIMDAGGGPGRYTIALAKNGYQMTLVDLSPELLRLAEKKIITTGVKNNIEKIEECSVTNLKKFKNTSFDAVICLGAVISHLTKLNDQKKAIKEFFRIAKPGAPIILGVLSKTGAFPRHVIKSAPELLPKLGEYLKYGNRVAKKEGEEFTESHYFSVDEIKKLIKNCNLKFIESVTVEGIAAGLKEEVNRLDDKKFKNLINFLIATSNDPSIAAMSEHMLVIAKK